MVFRLTKKRLFILQKLVQGWELGTTSGGRGPSFTTLQQGGHGRGGRTISVDYDVVFALYKYGLLQHRYSFPTQYWTLTDKGKSLLQERVIGEGK